MENRINTIISIGLWLLSLTISACTEDYETDFNYKPDDVNTDSLWLAGSVELQPGIHDAMVKVDFQRRNFRYYMPENLKSEGVALIFDFHGNMPYYIDNPYNPVGGFNEYHVCCKMADTANFIVVQPVGLFVEGVGIPGIMETLGWNDHEKNALFVDKMVEYFKMGCKGLDTNKIYATGISSGGIFCFGLAAIRSELFAAVAPLSGQYSINNNFVKPARVVPVLNMIGSLDNTVIPDAAYDNFVTWAINVGGYKKEEAISKKTEVYGRWATYSVDITAWQGRDADMEFWLLDGATHSIEETASWPAMWEFMRNHPKK